MRAAMVRTALLGMIAAAALAAAPAGAAVPASPGTYVIEGGSYAIEIGREGDRLVVIEPNKRSVYEPQSDGSWHFYNPNTDTVYGIRVIDRATIEAFKPGQPGNTPTRLVRLGGAPAEAEAAAPSPPSPVVRQANPAMEVAERYRMRAAREPKDAQAWTLCAAAALKRATGTGAEADEYARQTAEMLKQIMVDQSASPCEDAIPAAAWAAAAAPPDAGPSVAISEDEDDARRVAEGIERLQREGEERWRRLQAEAAEQKAAREAAQAAYERGVREAEQARAAYERDSAAHREALARAAAADAEYRRQLEERQRLIASGKYKSDD